MAYCQNENLQMGQSCKELNYYRNEVPLIARILTDSRYYKVTQTPNRLRNKSYKFDELTNSYTFTGKETKFCDIQHLYKFVNCGSCVWNVTIPQTANVTITDGIGKSNKLILFNACNLQDFVIEHQLYETTFANPRLCFGEKIFINSNVIKLQPKYVKLLLPPNIEHALYYTGLPKDTDESVVYDQALLKASNDEPHIIQFLEQQPEHIMLNAVSHDGMCLEFVKDKTNDVCKSAYANTKKAFKFVNKEFMTLDMCYDAIQYDTKLCKYVPDDLMDTCKEYVEQINYDMRVREEKHRNEMRSLCSRGAQDIYLMAPDINTFLKAYYTLNKHMVD
jgi:hypothetical protein